MNDRSTDYRIRLSIAAVERDTGLSKDTLRVWERRYGFPSPERDSVGERAYSIQEVEKLRLVKRLLDAGHRPGRIVPLPVQDLQHLTDQTVDQPTRQAEQALALVDLRASLDLVRRHDVAALRAELSRLLMRLGVARFVIDVVGPLNVVVGDAWIRGQIEVFEEHLYIEAIQTVLRQAIGAIPTPTGSAPRPRVLLSTFPGEMHGMGLLMLEALLALDGCECVSLGVQTPLWDVVLAARAMQTDIVALSFTACLNPNQVVEGLVDLREKLPETTQLWAGGSAPVLQRRSVPGVRVFTTLEEVRSELPRWQVQESLPAA